MTTQERLEIANKFIEAIATHGRKFFAYKDRVGKFVMDGWRIYFIDAYSQKKIYLHYKYWTFSQGGTCRQIVDDLRKFIQGKIKLPVAHCGPWPEWYCGDGDLWGYGHKEMEKVRAKVNALSDCA